MKIKKNGTENENDFIDFQTKFQDFKIHTPMS